MTAFGANAHHPCLVCGGLDRLERAHLVSCRERRAWHARGESDWIWHSNTIPLCRKDHITFDDLSGIVRGPAWTMLRHQMFTDQFRRLLELRELRRSLGPGGAPPRGIMVSPDWAARCVPLLEAAVNALRHARRSCS